MNIRLNHRKVKEHQVFLLPHRKVVTWKSSCWLHFNQGTTTHFKVRAWQGGGKRRGGKGNENKTQTQLTLQPAAKIKPEQAPDVPNHLGLGSRPISSPDSCWTLPNPWTQGRPRRTRPESMLWACLWLAAFFQSPCPDQMWTKALKMTISKMRSLQWILAEHHAS